MRACVRTCCPVSFDALHVSPVSEARPVKPTHASEQFSDVPLVSLDHECVPRRSFAGLSPPRCWFDLRPVDVGFVVRCVALVQIWFCLQNVTVRLLLEFLGTFVLNIA
jgi:hypothetical protein